MTSTINKIFIWKKIKKKLISKSI